MRTRSRGALASVVLLCSAVALVAAVPAAAAAGYLELYDKGKAAVEARRYAEGKSLLQQAIQENGKEGRVRIGMRFHDYQPSRWLAEASLGLGELDAAARYIDAASRTADAAEVADLRRRLESARASASRPPERQPPPRPAGPPPDALAAQQALRSGDLATARRLAERALTARPGDPTASEVRRSIEDIVAGRVARARRDVASGALDEADRALRDVLAIAPDDGSARALAAEVRSQRDSAGSALQRAEAALSRGDLATAETQARRARELDLSLAPRAGTVESDVARARRRAAAPPPDRRPEPASDPEPREERAALEDRVQEALESGDASRALAAVAAASAEAPAHPKLARWRERLEEVDPTVAGVSAYFRGDLDRSIELLEDRAEGRPRLLAVLAAAHASRALLLGEEEGRASLDQARELYARALRAQADLELDERLFSPRVRDLLSD